MWVRVPWIRFAPICRSTKREWWDCCEVLIGRNGCLRNQDPSSIRTLWGSFRWSWWSSPLQNEVVNPQSKTAYLESNLDASVRFVTPLNSGSGNVDHMEGAIETSGNNNDNYNPFSSWSCLFCVILVMNVLSWGRKSSSIERRGNENEEVQRKWLSHSMKNHIVEAKHRSNRDNKHEAKKRTMNTSHSEPLFAVWGILNHCEWPNSLV